MENKKGLHREVIERYCSIIDENTALFMICEREGTSYRCLRRDRCEREIGGCRNGKYKEK